MSKKFELFVVLLYYDRRKKINMSYEIMMSQRLPRMRYSLAKGNAPTGQRVCRFRQKSCHALRDWGSEKVVNISWYVFRLKSLSQNIYPHYLLKTKRDKENTFSLLPPQAVPLPHQREA